MALALASKTINLSRALAIKKLASIEPILNNSITYAIHG